MFNLLIESVIVGAGATIVMDIWGILRFKLLSLPALNYALVGRWVALFAKGQFVHPSIVNAQKVKGEMAFGWVLHYFTGILFAFVFLLAVEASWLTSPTALSPTLFGLFTCVVPFFIMQPAFGLGFAAAKTPNPTMNRIHTLITHGIYGWGLYLTATAWGF
ncbi:DUF2938 domain-containing protein [Vibrio sonorensis]|uniref:DUF2938 domain-containing protein n=1 Tax=Vibrio sonorensis TaxID=1004316 RepID=UPI0008DA4209|nr:DUF2938 domain-containing protein [Vibrio sonorensis]